MKIAISLTETSRCYHLIDGALTNSNRFLGAKLISSFRWVKKIISDFAETFSELLKNHNEAYRKQADALKKQFAEKDENGNPKSVKIQKTVLDNKGNPIEQEVSEYVMSDENRSMLTNALSDLSDTFEKAGKELEAFGEKTIVFEIAGIDPKNIPYFTADLMNEEIRKKYDADSNKLNDAELAAIMPFVIGSIETVSDDTEITDPQTVFQSESSKND